MCSLTLDERPGQRLVDSGPWVSAGDGFEGGLGIGEEFDAARLRGRDQRGYAPEATTLSSWVDVDFNPKLTHFFNRKIAHPMGTIYTLNPAVSQPQFRFDLIVLRRC